MDVFGFLMIFLLRLALFPLCLIPLYAQSDQQTTVFVVDQRPTFVTEELAVPKLTPYQARYQTSWRLGWFSIDIDATQTLTQLDNGEWYMEFHATSRPASMTETSKFRIENQQLQPLEYRFRSSGMLMEANRTVEFDWQQERVIDHERDSQNNEHWHPTLHDNLTYMQQARLDLANNSNLLEYTIYDKDRLRELRFERVGTERIKTAIGEIDTIKIQQIRSGKRTIYAWFAKDHDYVLVRLSEHNDGKKRSQIDIRSYQPDTKKAIR